jgi:hypothetical protein
VRLISPLLSLVLHLVLISPLLSLVPHLVLISPLLSLVPQQEKRRDQDKMGGVISI